ncbi:TIGR03564 family F420-dependent LLM class oxidoreductase [Nonomuraea sp. MG754425]|uniref:TIGR03564 family F420-dependent LLM class oxidoreductase n=1 Tax=Nonomuraea sp. MG754425 TaxID=2570319 RepID=UPI001F011794|nr:TIGR03564 family F420-dependent LLM class oxidoreductase [Nonomuraea sp. MG754425]MCF6468527.1 TIGR03564 family F420-dependent LLM class oxidoreductase [Nonomuraea sp. MG754425]
MRVGLYLNTLGTDLDTLLARMRTAAAAGFSGVFLSQLTSLDAITVAALGAREAPGLEVGTAVVQTFPRHPLALAGQALTAQAVSGNRFTLGVGPSHRQIIEGSYGLSYDRPARHTREYLSALVPLLRGEAVEYRGTTLSVAGQVEVPGATPPPVLLAALGPEMLRIAGELADGTVTTWTGAAAIADHVAPRITEAARAAGRPAPRVVASALVAVTDDPDRVREEVAGRLGFAAGFASYRSMLARQGLSGLHETVIAGDESTVGRELARFADAGTTDFLLSPAGDEPDQARTLDFAASWYADRP